MITNRLLKQITLYRNQFEKFMYDIFGDYRLERLSIELDGLMFRLKYMERKQIDLDKIPEIKKSFSEKALDMRKCFSEFMYEFICKIVTIPYPYKLDDIIDVLAQDVKIDPSYVKFQLSLISDNEDFLNYIDRKVPDDTPYDMFPENFFRFFTDSYNDGIAKAFPELFDNKRQHKIGTGDDANVFTRSLTFQVSERCSLGCTYCISGNTRIPMANGTYKRIKDIIVGDQVLGYHEMAYMNRNSVSVVEKCMEPAIVTQVFERTADTIILRSPYIHGDLYITPNHKVLTTKGWKPIGNLNGESIGFRDGKKIAFTNNYQVIKEVSEKKVYNLETTTHTYIADTLCVHNCYQFNKSEMRMNFDTAKEFIDNLLADKYGYLNRYNSPAIIIEFIGGEPLLEINLIRRIYEYFLDECYRLNHPWFLLHRLSICSNGMQYFDNNVQSFFKDYASQVSFNISIDGNKELHDSCRIQHNHEGSYDIDMAALNHYNKHYSNERNSKMTLAPQNIQYLFESVVDFINKGSTIINLNCVFEEGWTAEHAHIEYEQLKLLSDYIIEHDLHHIYLSIFTERQEGPQDKLRDGSSCGGSGSMLAIRPNGEFYPCIRYMPSSVGNNVRDLKIGNVHDGMDSRDNHSDVLSMLDSMTRRTQSTDICWECPIANNCMCCLACNHTVYGTPNRRTTFTCIMNVAESLANAYFWNSLLAKHPSLDIEARRIVVPDEWALRVIDKDELDLLKLIEANALIIKMENR